MALELAPLQVLAWLATYLVHSTLLLGLAWLVTRRRARLSPGSRERLWKLAVFGGFLTATLQVGLGLEPPLGRLALRGEPVTLADRQPSTQQPEPAATQRPARAASRAQDQGAPVAAAPLRRPPGHAPRRGAADRASSSRPATVPASRRASALRWPAAVVWPLRAGLDLASRSPSPAAEPPVVARTTAAAQPPASRGDARLAPRLGATVPGSLSRGALIGWSLAGLACVLLFALGLRRLRRDLAGRVELLEGPVAVEVERLRLRAGVPRRVRVFVAPHLAAPLSMGWVRPVICVPPRALDELEPEERSAMLAHEVAHLARRDPLWLFALWLVETACFFQPLNRLARRELAATFELAADGWAARATGDRLALASSLARIAGWIVGEAPPRAHRAWTAAMADALDARRPRSRLGERIERLLDADALDEPPRRRRLESVLGLTLLAGRALLAPGAAAASGPERSAVPAPLPAPLPAPARTPATSTTLLAGLDVELERLEAELVALRAELAAVGLEGRFAALLAELELRVQRLAERRARIERLLARARALQAVTPATSPSTSAPWQDAPLPRTKGTSR